MVGALAFVEKNMPEVKVVLVTAAKREDAQVRDRELAVLHYVDLGQFSTVPDSRWADKFKELAEDNRHD